MPNKKAIQSEQLETLNKKLIISNEQLKKQIDNLRKQSDEIVYQLQNLINIATYNFTMSNKNFEAIKKRINYGIQFKNSTNYQLNNLITCFFVLYNNLIAYGSCSATNIINISI